jgi:hypothetical protein
MCVHRETKAKLVFSLVKCVHGCVSSTAVCVLVIETREIVRVRGRRRRWGCEMQPPTFGIRASRSEAVAAARRASCEVEAEGARRRLLAVRCR